jgi:uncharacterized protein (DUF169 family)
MSGNWGFISERLIRLLRLRTSPVAVKLYGREEEIPQGIEKPTRPITLCQFVNLSRIHGKILLGKMENIVCAYAQSFLGFSDFPPDLLAGKRAIGRRTETAEAYEKILRDMPKINGGETVAVLTSPLEKMPVEPDLVLVFGNAAQVMRLIHSATWKRGERMSIRTAAEAGTCGEGIAATYLLKRPTIAFPCYGSRRFGLAGDDEIIFGIPIENLGEILECLEKSHKTLPYPILQQVEVTPEPPLIYYIRIEPPP